MAGAVVDGVRGTLSRDERAIAKECIVDPAGGFGGPDVGLARLALRSAFGIIGHRVGKGDELEVDAVREDLYEIGY